MAMHLKEDELQGAHPHDGDKRAREAFFLPSRAGKSVLIFQNNKFWVNNQYRDKLNWACRDKDAKGCLCRVQTTLNGRFIRIKGGHNHQPNFTPYNFDGATGEKHSQRAENGVKSLV
ncbi:unnamed protein product [Leptosia nina]|uniref:FLYWCH-type domain-containing protein n=1 Tax=Leptosia nina TaxID=320188 RepID=A0AAV1J618_9NEOP